MLSTAGILEVMSPKPQEAADQEAPKKKKRKRNPENRAYSKASENRETRSKKKNKQEEGKAPSLLPMRVDNKPNFEVDGEMVELKTAAVIYSSPLMRCFPDPNVLLDSFALNQNKVKTNRPVKEITQWSPGGKTPLQVKTPGDTRLSLASKNGVICGFRNGPKRLFGSPKRSVDAAFADSAPYKAVKANSKLIKHVKTFITAASLKAAAQEIQANDGQRSVGQNAVMAVQSKVVKQASANLYAQAAQLAVPGERWEWLHLIAHFILAKKAQEESNLGAGTYHANSEMLSVELALRSLASIFPQGFSLEVKAYCIPDTQILTTIDYTITAVTPEGDLVLPFVFDAQQKNQPDIYTLSYVNALVEALKELMGPPEAADKENVQPNPKKLDN